MAPHLDPTNWLVAGVALAVAWLVGRLYRDPWWAVVVNAVGAAAFVVGIRWAVSLGPQPGAAAVLATLGIALTALVARRAGRDGRTSGAVPTNRAG